MNSVWRKKLADMNGWVGTRQEDTKKKKKKRYRAILIPKNERK